MKAIIALLPGDGVGPEVTEEAVKVLRNIGQVFGHEFVFKKGCIGACAIDKKGDPLPDETLELCASAQAILFGAIGDPKYDNDPKAKVRPEQGLLRLRKSLGLYANIRPIFVFEEASKLSPLKQELLQNVDFIVVRELTGGIYFGKKGRNKRGNEAYDVLSYSTSEIERIAKTAFDLAMRRKKKVTLVDKANVLETSRLWREVIGAYRKQYPQITVEAMFVDNAAMQIIKRPADFDVILTENMFGDILTDEASVIAGSLGMLPSASIGLQTSLYEPIHGSFPKAAGKHIANPIGAILSAGMMLSYSFNLEKESKAVFVAVKQALKKGFGTKDIMKDNPLSTSELGDKICSFI